MSPDELRAMLPESLEGYRRLALSLQRSRTNPHRARVILRTLGRVSLYFLIRYLLGRRDIEHPWLLARCIEVQNEPDGMLDLWARDHRKSTIITFGKTIQDVLASHGEEPLPEWGGQEVTVGILSHTRPIAKSFLRQIKREFEANPLLKELYPDVLWSKPHAEAPKWSEDDGLIVRRRSNPKESTVEAWGLVDSQPTGKHFHIRVYDDVVTEDSVGTPEMIAKTLRRWELSDNLGMRGGRVRHIGTRYHANDAYRTIMERGAAVTRLYPATDDGTPTGEPVFLTPAELEAKRRKQGSFTFACQQLQNPTADSVANFKPEWLQHYREAPDRDSMNVYMMVDPASSKKRESDYTAIMVVGLHEDECWYVLDMVRDRFNLGERARKVIELHRRWRPVCVGYEKYGMQADIEYLEETQERERYRFKVTPLAGTLGNEDRVRRLIPTHEDGRWWYPRDLSYRDYEGSLRDLVTVYRDEEFIPFPVGVHVDMMDALSRVMDDDMNARFPMGERSRPRHAEPPEHSRAGYGRGDALEQPGDVV